MLEAKELLEKVDTELVIEIMEEHGAPVLRKTVDGRTGQECLWFRTICHGGDSDRLCFFTESKDYYCYTLEGRITFYDFIMKIEGCDFYAALKYIARKLGISDRTREFETDEERERADFLRNRANRQAQRNKTPVILPGNLPIYPQTYLDLFEEGVYYTGWLKEGISAESMNKYGIRWHEGENHIIIPHYDIDGRLIGIRRRSLNPEDSRNKYMPETINGELCQHPLALNLYGLDKNKKAIQNSKIAIIVEAEKSVLLSDTYYGDSSIAVATCGFNISNRQISLLRELGVQDIFLGFDKDFDVLKRDNYRQDRISALELQHYLDRLQMLGDRLKNYFGVYYLLDTKNLLQIKDSPFDRGKKIFEQLYQKPLYINTTTDKEKKLEKRIDDFLGF